MKRNYDYITKLFYPNTWELTVERLNKSTTEERMAAESQAAVGQTNVAAIIAVALVSLAYFRYGFGAFTMFMVFLAVVVLFLRYFIVKERPKYVRISEYAWYFYETDPAFRQQADIAKKQDIPRLIICCTLIVILILPIALFI